MEALKLLVEFTFDYHLKHAAIVRLVMVENIHKGRHVAKLPAVTPVNSPILETVADILRRGAAEGTIRDGLDNFVVYSAIAAQSFFNVSNRYTIRAIFRHDMVRSRGSCGTAAGHMGHGAALRDALTVSKACAILQVGFGRKQCAARMLFGAMGGYASAVGIFQRIGNRWQTLDNAEDIQAAFTQIFSRIARCENQALHCER